MCFDEHVLNNAQYESTDKGEFAIYEVISYVLIDVIDVARITIILFLILLPWCTCLYEFNNK